MRNRGDAYKFAYYLLIGKRSIIFAFIEQMQYKNGKE